MGVQLHRYVLVGRSGTYVRHHLGELGVEIGVVMDDFLLAVLFPVDVGRPALQGELITRNGHRRRLGAEFVCKVAVDANDLVRTGDLPTLTH